ncbi:AGP2beta-2 [Trypanosoma theileri]|uniref:AGP2beta-2 n=1 Tax=Trypanosoma theileri TaxID=67003 RepID=A0A1X0P1G9_9TRYP|nr:AGP2beta-2 [Trypanosoma theileri]ORC90678.1 AGP2beta-2 [Trypanosoma theileri]
MQQKITRDVRIVFSLLVNMITECLPGKTYIVQIKRGDKINASSPVLTADDKGIVHVGLKRIFTSTLQRRNDWNYKRKELKFSITEVHTQKVIRLCYDISKSMDGECFPKRRVIMKGREGSPQLQFELEGTEETRYNQEHGIELTSNISFTSYMREPSSESLSGQPGIIECREGDSVESSLALSEFESVVDSVTEASIEEKKKKNENAQLEENRENTKEYGVNNTTMESISPSCSEFYHGQNISFMTYETQATNYLNKDKHTLETQDKEGLTSDIIKGNEIKPPPKVPLRRIVISSYSSSSSSDLVLEAVKRIHNTVTLDSISTENLKSLKKPPTGAQLAMNYYLKWNGESQRCFILHFIAHVIIEVCRETRHLGDWLSLLTHVMYRSILYAHGELKSSSIHEVTLQIAEISSLDDKNFISRGNQIIEKLADHLNLSAASELFWIAGLEYCAATIVSLPMLHLERLCNNFPMILPFSEEASFSFEEYIITGTTILYSELNSIISTLNSTSGGEEPHLIYTTPPLYRIVLVTIVRELFIRILSVITKGMYKHSWSDDNSGSYIALRVLKLSKSWAKKNRLLSALSTCLMPLIAYCDLVLFPDELLQGDSYKSLIIRFPPLVDVVNENDSEYSNSQTILAMISDGLETTKEFSLFNTLIEFTPSKCDKKSNVEDGIWGLLEVLNGDESEAREIISTEEIFHGTGFNGIKNTLHVPGLVLPLLRNEVMNLTESQIS